MTTHVQHVFSPGRMGSPALDPGWRCENSLRAGQERWVSVDSLDCHRNSCRVGRVTGSLFGDVCGSRGAAEVLRLRLTLKQSITRILGGPRGRERSRELFAY